jgi:hypothetical protein
MIHSRRAIAVRGVRATIALPPPALGHLPILGSGGPPRSCVDGMFHIYG